MACYFTTKMTDRQPMPWEVYFNAQERNHDCFATSAAQPCLILVQTNVTPKLINRTSGIRIL
jgi:hypothetical protein